MRDPWSHNQAVYPFWNFCSLFKLSSKLSSNRLLQKVHHETTRACMFSRVYLGVPPVYFTCASPTMGTISIPLVYLSPANLEVCLGHTCRIQFWYTQGICLYLGHKWGVRGVHWATPCCFGKGTYSEIRPKWFFSLSSWLILSLVDYGVAVSLGRCWFSVVGSVELVLWSWFCGVLSTVYVLNVAILKVMSQILGEYGLGRGCELLWWRMVKVTTNSLFTAIFFTDSNCDAFSM